MVWLTRPQLNQMRESHEGDGTQKRDRRERGDVLIRWCGRACSQARFTQLEGNICDDGWELCEEQTALRITEKLKIYMHMYRKVVIYNM